MTEQQMQLPKGWELKTLGDVGQYINGRGFKKAEWSQTGLPIIRIQNLTGTSSELNHFDGEIDDKHVIDNGDLLISWSATLGAYFWNRGKAALNQHIFKVVSKIDKKFHYYLIQNILNDLYRQTHGSGMVHITKAKFESTQVSIPQAEIDQKQIVAKIEELFSHIDAGIESLKTAQEKLKQYRQSVLKAAVTGELTKAWREANASTIEPADQLLKRIQTERRQRWEQQKLAEFQAKGKPPKNDKWKEKYKEPDGFSSEAWNAPKNWKIVRAEEICEFITKGTTPKKDKLTEYVGDIPFIKVYNLTFDTTLDFSVEPTFTDVETHNGFLARSKVYPGDVLMNIVGPPLGKVSVVPSCHKEWNMNQAIAVFRPIIFSNKLLAYFLLSDPVLNWMKSKTKTTAGQVNLTLEICRDAPISLPPVEEQKQIVQIVEEKLSSADRLINEIETKLTQAQQQKQTILASAFSGKLI